MNDLATTNPEMLEECDYAANDAEHLSPQAVRANQAIKVHWICEKCGHKWMASLSNRCGGPDGPVCGAETLRKKIRQRNVEVNSGAADSLILTKLWSDRNDQKPDEVSCGSHQEIWRRNDEWGHDWQATPHSMTKRPLCPVCYPAGCSAGEIELFKFVQSYCRQHGVSKVISNDRSLLSRVMSPDGRKRMYGLDVYMPDLRLAFEYNGDYWRSDDVITTVHPVFSSADEYHGLKKTACLERGVQLMFVWEHEWKHRRSPVEDEVRSTIDDKPAILSSTLAGASTVTSR